MNRLAFEERLTEALERLASEADAALDPGQGAADAIRPRSPVRLALGVLAAVVAVAMVGLVVRSGPAAQGPAASVLPSASSTESVDRTPSPTSVPAPEPVEVLRLDLAVYDLAYDAERGTLWFATMQSVASDELHRLDVATGAHRSWALPDTEHNGFLSEVELAADGSAWVSMAYRLVRFDSDSETMASYQFDVTVPGVDAERVGGTWIQALGVSGDGVWLVRNGVPFLTFVEASADGSTLRTTAQLTLGPAYAHASDVAVLGDRLFIVRTSRDDGAGNTTPGGVGIFDAAGAELRLMPMQASRLDVVGDRLLARGGDSAQAETAWLTRDGLREAVEPGVLHPAAAAVGMDAAVTYSAPPGGDGQFVLHRGGKSVELAVLAGREVELRSCPWGPASSPSATPSECPSVWVAPDISAIAADEAGSVWYVENLGQGSVVWRLPLPPS